LFVHVIWIATAVLLAFYVTGIMPFVRLLAKRMNRLQLIGAIAMHLCYHIYASCTYVAVILATRLGLRQPAARPFPTPSKRATELAK